MVPAHTLTTIRRIVTCHSLSRVVWFADAHTPPEPHAQKRCFRRSPGVLAVAVAIAKIVVAYPAVATLELEIRDPCRILVVEYSLPNRSHERLRYVPAAPCMGYHLNAELAFLG